MGCTKSSREFIFFQQSNTGHQRRQHQLNASTLASTDVKKCFRFRGGDYWIAMYARGVVGKRATAARTVSSSTQGTAVKNHLLLSCSSSSSSTPWDCCCRSCLQLSSSGNLCTLSAARDLPFRSPDHKTHAWIARKGTGEPM